MIIGICGKSGSGKSTLAKELINQYGNEIIHLDIDKIGHQVLTIPKVIEELINTFGKHIITNRFVDRKKLGKIVFNSQKEMDKLTEITWKYMELEINKILLENKNKIIILDWILLPKTKYLNKCNLKILLDIPYEIRKERTIKRDNITNEAFELREKSSPTYDELDFDYIIKDNNYENIKRLVKSYE